MARLIQKLGENRRKIDFEPDMSEQLVLTIRIGLLTARSICNQQCSLVLYDSDAYLQYTWKQSFVYSQNRRQRAPLRPTSLTFSFNLAAHLWVVFITLAHPLFTRWSIFSKLFLCFFRRADESLNWLCGLHSLFLILEINYWQEDRGLRYR